jgi:hypothetical protein
MKPKQDWENPEIFGINKQPARCYFIHFPEKETDWRITSGEVQIDLLSVYSGMLTGGECKK